MKKKAKKKNNFLVVGRRPKTRIYHLLVPRLGHGLLRLSVLSRVFRKKMLSVTSVASELHQLHAGADGGVASVHEDHHLVAFPNEIDNLQN